MFIPFFDKSQRENYLRLAATLRDQGISSELYPDPKKLGVQLKYADAHGFPVALIAGGNEWDSGKIQIKLLDKKQSVDVNYRHDQPAELLAKLAQALGGEL